MLQGLSSVQAVENERYGLERTRAFWLHLKGLRIPLADEGQQVAHDHGSVSTKLHRRGYWANEVERWTTYGPNSHAGVLTDSAVKAP